MSSCNHFITKRHINGINPTSIISQLTGGISSTSGGFAIVTFNTSGTITLNTTKTIGYLLVGGGGGGSGGGGAVAGGGGGSGGGVNYCSVTSSSKSMTNGQQYSITVGTGGTPGNGTSVMSGNGGTSSITLLSLTAVGGNGGTWDPTNGVSMGTTTTAITTTLLQGGTSVSGIGGAGANVQNAQSGGNGVTINLSSVVTGTFGGGGGGGTQPASSGFGGGLGGTGGGGKGYNDTGPDVVLGAGLANTGGGGGGAGGNATGAGSYGGTGIVVIYF